MTKRQAKNNPQMGFEERRVDDSELEDMLEERESLKKPNKEYRQINKKVRERLNSIESPTPYRVGRFVISRNPISPRHVEFDSEGGERFTIKIAGD